MSMNRQTIKDAKTEAQAFITACDEALARLDEEAANGWGGGRKPTPGDQSGGSPQTGTLRRKSMDLTRILATLRRYGA